MLKIVAIGSFVILASFSFTKPVQGVVDNNFHHGRSYINTCLQEFASIVDNAQFTNPIHTTYEQSIQDATDWETIAQAADYAYASYEDSVRNQLQSKWGRIRTAYIIFIAQMMDYTNSVMYISQYQLIIRIPMLNFTNLFEATNQIMGSRPPQVQQRRQAYEEILNGQIRYFVSQDRVAMGLPAGDFDAVAPDQGVNPDDDDVGNASDEGDGNE